ncbi:MAG: uncharacterized protein QOI93_1352 [Rhodospirillaceae bacterium]|jgi:hypothetical protein|nr:uncharacterized protein [Rhodospirillaceae bacterium]
MKPRVIAMLVAPLLLLAPTLSSAQAVQPTSQPAAEAMAQKLLPKVRDTLWSKLIKCEVSYDEKKDVYSIQVTPDVKALDGQTVTVRGFILPMDGSDRTKHFLVSRNTPVCMFCPPGQPNEVVEVRSTRAIEWTDKIATVTGKLSLINDGEKALFFKIENAQVGQ